MGLFIIQVAKHANHAIHYALIAKEHLLTVVHVIHQLHTMPNIRIHVNAPILHITTTTLTTLAIGAILYVRIATGLLKMTVHSAKILMV